MIPLQIVAHMVSPLAGDASVPIDGILLSVVCGIKYGPIPASRPNQSYAYDPADCPLQVITPPDGAWFYASSFAQYPDGSVESTAYWNKRFDYEHALSHTVAKNVEISKGTYKAYHTPMTITTTTRIVWYVVGDQARIEVLLGYVHFIGKKRAQGWGEVLRWEVSPTERDYSLITPSGTLARPIPMSLRDYQDVASGVGVIGIRPSYWDKSNQVGAWLP